MKKITKIELRNFAFDILMISIRENSANDEPKMIIKK